MNIYDSFRNCSLESLADWIDNYGQHDDSPWMNWFDKTYCQKCDSIIVTREDAPKILGYKLNFASSTECSYCEIYTKCRFFPEQNEVTTKDIIRMWLQQEVTNECE